MRRFFQQTIDENNLVINDDESKHILRVLRMKEGDTLVLFDGSKKEYLCRISSIFENRLTLELIDKYEVQEENYKVTLYQGLIKNDNIDYVVQKCSECGVEKIVFFTSERCVKKLDDKACEKLINRQKKIAIESAKQCRRVTIPEIDRVYSINDIELKHTLTLLAYEDEEKTTIKDIVKNNMACDIGIIIGCEGGFSKKEVEMLVKKGAKAVSLGKNILRAETAGVSAISMINYERME